MIARTPLVLKIEDLIELDRYDGPVPRPCWVLLAHVWSRVCTCIPMLLHVDDLLLLGAYKLLFNKIKT